LNVQGNHKVFLCGDDEDIGLRSERADALDAIDAWAMYRRRFYGDAQAL
jgi:hypothetical protein